MKTVNIVQRNRYQDSVTLMQAAVRLREIEGIEDAALMMGTEPNKEILAEAGLLVDESDSSRSVRISSRPEGTRSYGVPSGAIPAHTGSPLGRHHSSVLRPPRGTEIAGPNDLIIALRGSDQGIATATRQLEIIMSTEGPETAKEGHRSASTNTGDGGRRTERAVHSLAGGFAEMPNANLVLISTPGIYAASEARKALSAGRHVMIFSDNVSLEDEIMLKTIATERGLLLMGPDCGTAIIGGVPLGFANAVRRGPIGVVGASGTGMQEITTLVDRYGGGISHAIGTGSRDLSAQVGALSTLAGLAALQNDPDTKVIVVVSKPPDAAVASRVIEQAGQGDKPVVIAFLGIETRTTNNPMVIFAQTLEDAARQAASLAWALEPTEAQTTIEKPTGHEGANTGAALSEDHSSRGRRTKGRRARGPEGTPLMPHGRPRAYIPEDPTSTSFSRTIVPDKASHGSIRGLFSGGTFCYEAMLILEKSLGPTPKGPRIFSNAPLSPGNEITIRNPPSSFVLGIRNRHVCLDLGADEFTVGRPHPMIDMTSRIERILLEAGNPDVSVILLDVVLGYGAHPNPAGALAPAVMEAKAQARAQGRTLEVVASVCGTDVDPQNLSRQQNTLREAGVIVSESNAEAARLVAAMLGHSRISQGDQSLEVPPGPKMPTAASMSSLDQDDSSRPRGRPAHRRTENVAPYSNTGAALSEDHSSLRGRQEPYGRPRAYKIADLLSSPPGVLDLGVPTFADTLTQVGAPHLHLDWRPPASGDPDLGRTLAILMDEETPGSPGALIKAANERAIERILAADPVWEDVRPAREIWPEMDDRLLFHAGPPIEWDRMCGPMQGAITGAILLEGWASDEEGAHKLASSGGVRFAPCHHYHAVGPMAGLVSPSMPMFVVRNAEAGNVAYSSLNEGMGKVLRYGAFAPEVLARLRWMCYTLGPTLQIGIQALGGLHLKPLMAQALQMGDELHNRHIAATSLLFKNIAPALIRALDDRERVAAALDPIATNNYFFLNLAMAAAKSTLDAAHGIPHSSVVTAMARNGVDFGIRVSGAGDRWFTGPAGTPKGLYLPGFTEDDAAGDIGDSAITETCGLGGFAMAGAPAVVKVVGGTPDDAVAYTQAMYTITLARNPHWTLPPLGFAGTPTGIDVRRVVDSGTLPIINTGIAHRQAGIGQVGAGLVNPPMQCFTEALRALGEA